MKKIEFKNACIVSKYDTRELEKILKSFGFKLSKRNPDLILCYGGDGTILYAERIFPGIPKLVIKKFSRIFRKFDYPERSIKKILRKIKLGEYKILEEIKIFTRFEGVKLVGLNEIQVHNKLPTEAIRFSLWTNGKSFKNLVGDGVIVSTPFGSTAYYSSTGGKPFKKGIGISFNNLYKKRIKSFIVPEDSKVRVRVLKGYALLVVDNYRRFVNLKRGDSVLIRKSKDVARFIQVL